MAGQIIPRGDRTWMVRVFIGRDPMTGKRKYEGQTVHGTKKDAQKKLNEALSKIDKGEYVPNSSRISVSSLLDDLLSDYRVNGTDADGIEKKRLENHVRPFFGRMLASKVGTSEIQRYIEERRSGPVSDGTPAGRRAGAASNATINRELALLRHAFYLGSEHEPPKVARVPRISMLAEDNVRKGFFEHEAFLAIRIHLSEEIRPVVIFAYYTGCRKGEILKLLWSQIDFTERVVRLEPGETKNEEGRMIPLAPELYETLVMLKEQRDRLWPDSPWMFSRAGKRIHDFRDAWESACEKAGLVDAEGEPEKLFHDLRRTGVRNLIRSGVPEKVAMMISGHKTRAVLDRYNIVDERDLKDAARKLGEYLSRKPRSRRAPQPIRKHRRPRSTGSLWCSEMKAWHTNRHTSIARKNNNHIKFLDSQRDFSRSIG
jgi:integrase